MKKLIIPVLILATLASCEKATEPGHSTNSDEPQVIKLSAGITTIATTSKSIVAGSSFESPSEIGLYAISGTDNHTWGTDLLYNNDGKITVTGNAITLKKGEDVFSFYYPTNGNTVQFFAYYPTVDPAQLTKPTDDPVASAKATYTLTGQEDIMFATATSKSLNEDIAQDKVDLKFNHKLAKINFQIKADASFPTSGELSNITITGTKTSVTMDINDGSLSFGEESGNITAFDGNKAMTEAIISEAFGDVMIQPGATYGLTITVSGITYTVTDITAPAEGIANTVELTFKGSEVDATASITPWGTSPKTTTDVQK